MVNGSRVMKFAINIEYGNYNSDKRVTAFTAPYNYFNREGIVECKFHVNAIILTTCDFTLDSDEIQKVSDSCSIQYRPKGLHKNTKGVFYKLDGKPIYLTPDEIEELNEFISKCISQKELLVQRKRN